MIVGRAPLHECIPFEIPSSWRQKYFLRDPSRQSRSVAGFTLLEMLLSIAVLSVLVSVAVPISQTFQNRNDLENTAISVVQSLRRAAALSQAVDGDTTSGVKVQNGSITVFHGASYATRLPGFDELFAVPTSITVSGTTEYVFAKLTGFPVATGAFTLTSINNETRTITINAKGMVNY